MIQAIVLSVFHPVPILMFIVAKRLRRKRKNLPSLEDIAPLWLSAVVCPHLPLPWLCLSHIVQVSHCSPDMDPLVIVAIVICHLGVGSFLGVAVHWWTMVMGWILQAVALPDLPITLVLPSLGCSTSRH